MVANQSQEIAYPPPHNLIHTEGGMSHTPQPKVHAAQVQFTTNKLKRRAGEQVTLQLCTQLYSLVQTNSLAVESLGISQSVQ